MLAHPASIIIAARPIVDLSILLLSLIDLNIIGAGL